MHRHSGRIVAAALGFIPGALLAQALGTATLTWTPPTENTDGTPLTNLAGYRVYWGTSPPAFTHSRSLPNPAITGAVIDQLSPGAWFFAVTALNAVGVESAFSNFASKVIAGDPEPEPDPQPELDAPGPVRNLAASWGPAPDRATFERLQSAAGVGAATLPSSPAAGNMLVAVVAHRSSDAGAPTLSTPGWTQRVSRPTLLTDLQARRALVVYTKNAGPNEPRTLSAQWGSATIAVQIAEYSAGWVFESAAAADTGIASTSPLRTSSAAGDEPRASIAVAMWRGQVNAPSGISWGPAGMQPHTFVQSADHPLVLSTAYGTALEYAVAWSGAGHEATAAVLVFR